MSYEKNKYITAYGSSNTDSYGRGDVTDVSTKYSMLTTNPLSDENAPEMNSYSSDGSYNQDIFGWKCFNSPVSFRNGIYGECGYIASYKYSVPNANMHSGVEISTYSYTNGNSSISSSITLSTYTMGNLQPTSEIKFSSTRFVIGAGTGEYSNILPSGDVRIGSKFSRFKELHVETVRSDHIYTSDFACDSYIADKSTSIGLLDDSYEYKSLIKCSQVNEHGNYCVEPDVEQSSTTVALGSVSNKFKNVWANNLHGVVPHVDLTNADASVDIKYPIGCIIKARVSLSAFSSVTARKLPAGTESIRPGAGTIYEMLYDAYNETYITDSATNLNSMSWKTLISVTRSQDSIELDKTFDIYIMRVG